MNELINAVRKDYGVLVHYKERETMSFARKGMNLEIVTLKEISKLRHMPLLLSEM